MLTHRSMHAGYCPTPATLPFVLPQAKLVAPGDTGYRVALMSGKVLNAATIDVEGFKVGVLSVLLVSRRLSNACLDLRKFARKHPLTLLAAIYLQLLPHHLNMHLTESPTVHHPAPSPQHDPCPPSFQGVKISTLNIPLGHALLLA